MFLRLCTHKESGTESQINRKTIIRKSERQRTYSEVSDKRGNLQPLSLVVLGETTGLFYFYPY